MFSMSRFEWMAKFFQSNPRPRVKRAPRERRTMPTWNVMGHRISAYTKSEARAIVKRQLGVERLPVGTFVSQVTA